MISTNFAALLLGFVARQLANGQTCNYAMDMLLAQDVSGSFKDSLGNVSNAMTKLISDLEARHEGSRFKLTMFTDLPIWPYGCDHIDKTYQDTPYKSGTDWTTASKDFQRVLDVIGTEWGVDMEEAQLSHLAHICDRGVFTLPADTRSKLQRVIVMPTDAEFHEAGDLYKLTPERRAKECSSETAKLYKGDIACCTLDGTFEYSDYDRDAEHLYTFGRESNTFTYMDYPTLDYTVQRLVEEEISVIFLLSKQVLKSDRYQSFVQKMADAGGYATIVELEENSTNLFDAVTSGLSEIGDYVCKVPVTATTTKDPATVATTTLQPATVATTTLQPATVATTTLQPATVATTTLQPATVATTTLQ
eukprot:Lankesteria_metandrocarpae@DN4311_c1_g1_i1.p1